MCKILGNYHIFRIAAVGVLAGPFGMLAKIFLPAAAKTASSAALVQPCNPDAVAFFEFAHRISNLCNDADYLMTGHYRQFRGVDPAFSLIEVGVAGAANFDFN